MSTANLTVRYKFFRHTLATWETLFSEAAEFASRIGRERLIGISQSQWGADAVVAVWYWDGPRNADSGF
jgi:hypothetical protein